MRDLGVVVLLEGQVLSEDYSEPVNSMAERDVELARGQSGLYNQRFYFVPTVLSVRVTRGVFGDFSLLEMISVDLLDSWVFATVALCTRCLSV